MKRVAFHLLCLSTVTAAVMAPATANAGEILRATPASDFEWRTTECRKPIQNKSSSISTQVSLERYSEDITKYLACLQREAQNDFNKSQMLMQQAIERELEAETKRMDEKIRLAYRTRR